MIAKAVRYFGQPCILICDAKCRKAWGINNRPQIYVGDPAQEVYGYGFKREVPQGVYDQIIDENDTFYLSDDELGEAPIDPGTYEGGHAKPQTPEQRLNKWCARECERSKLIDDKDAPEDFTLPDFSQRLYNMSQPAPESDTP